MGRDLVAGNKFCLSLTCRALPRVPLDEPPFPLRFRATQKPKGPLPTIGLILPAYMLKRPACGVTHAVAKRPACGVTHIVAKARALKATEPKETRRTSKVETVHGVAVGDIVHLKAPRHKDRMRGAGTVEDIHDVCVS